MKLSIPFSIEATCLNHSLRKKKGQIIAGPVRTQHDDERRCCVSSGWVLAGEKRWIKMNQNHIWLKIERGGSPAPPGGRSATGAPPGRSPGCGCWGLLLCSAAVSGSPPGRGCYGDQLPCVKLCGREPAAHREKEAWVPVSRVERTGRAGEQVEKPGWNVWDSPSGWQSPSCWAGRSSADNALAPRSPPSQPDAAQSCYFWFPAMEERHKTG